MTDETLGERLHRLRTRRDLSLRELAREAGEAGVTYSYLSRVELGTRMPSAKTVRLLAPVLGVSAHYLEFGFDLECPHCGEPVDYDVSGRPLVAVG